MSIRLHTVRSVDGTTIAYEEFGAGSPLVLIHGSISDRTYWTPVIPPLAERLPLSPSTGAVAETAVTPPLMPSGGRPRISPPWST